MSAIKGKDTKPELLVRRALHAAGFRFRLHVKELPGRPDLVLSKYRAVVLVHGCFWHRHGCEMFKLPKDRRPFWDKKLSGNASRDEATRELLQAEGWRVLVVWECAVRGRGKISPQQLIDQMSAFLRSDLKSASIGTGALHLQAKGSARDE